VSTNALVYLNPSLPIRIENADRLVYLPDGSQHVLDANDRPLFVAPAGAGVCIVMEYAQNEDAKESQVAPFAREEHVQKQEQSRREEVAAEQTQQFSRVPDVVNVNQSQVVPLGRIARFEPRPQQMQPGEVKVQTAAEVPSDVTGEVVMPDFPGAPTGAIPESEGSSSPQSPQQGETRKTPGPGRAAG
jgi:hypothetical protein